MFDILHVFYNGPSTLLRTGKILAMDHYPFTRGRGICLLEGGPHSMGETNLIIALRSN